MVLCSFISGLEDVVSRDPLWQYARKLLVQKILSEFAILSLFKSFSRRSTEVAAAQERIPPGCCRTRFRIHVVLVISSWQRILLVVVIVVVLM